MKKKKKNFKRGIVIERKPGEEKVTRRELTKKELKKR